MSQEFLTINGTANWALMITLIFYGSDILIIFTGKLMSLYQVNLDKNLFPGLLSILFRLLSFCFLERFLLCAVLPLSHACLPWEWLLLALGFVIAYFRKYEFSVIIHNSLKDRVWSRVLKTSCC